MCASKCAISAARCAWRSSGWPRLFSSSRRSRPSTSPSSRHSARHIRISSASTSGPAIAQRLGADLVELSIATLLRPLVTEHRADVVQPLAAVVQERMLLDRAHHPGGGLRAQGELVAVHACRRTSTSPSRRCRSLRRGRARTAPSARRSASARSRSRSAASASAACPRATPSAANAAAGCRSSL